MKATAAHSVTEAGAWSKREEVSIWDNSTISEPTAVASAVRVPEPFIVPALTGSQND